MNPEQMRPVPALPEDAGEIARLEALCFSLPRSEAMVLSEITQPERYLILTLKGPDGLEGYVGLEYVLDEGYITDLAVFPERRRCGLGRTLLRELEHRSREMKLRFLTLEVRPSNAAAVTLYRSEGYEEAGLRKNYYMRPMEDALLMTKYL